MSVQISFDNTRFRRAIGEANAKNQELAGKRIGFACPECGATNAVTVDQVARQTSITCTGCRKNIDLLDKGGGFGRSVRGE